MIMARQAIHCHNSIQNTTDPLYTTIVVSRNSIPNLHILGIMNQKQDLKLVLQCLWGEEQQELISKMISATLKRIPFLYSFFTPCEISLYLIVDY